MREDTQDKALKGRGSSALEKKEKEKASSCNCCASDIFGIGEAQQSYDAKKKSKSTKAKKLKSVREEDEDLIAEEEGAGTGHGIPISDPVQDDNLEEVDSADPSEDAQYADPENIEDQFNLNSEALEQDFAKDPSPNTSAPTSARGGKNKKSTPGNGSTSTAGPNPWAAVAADSHAPWGAALDPTAPDHNSPWGAALELEDAWEKAEAEKEERHRREKKHKKDPKWAEDNDWAGWGDANWNEEDWQEDGGNGQWDKYDEAAEGAVPR